MTESAGTQIKGNIHPALIPLAVPIEDLHLDPENARHHDRGNLDAVKYMFQRFGQRQPIVVQEEGMIVRAGNARLMVARELGWSHVAALVVDESDLEAAEYALGDNRTSDLGMWDTEALAKVVSALSVNDVDLTDLGWSPAEISGMMYTDQDAIDASSFLDGMLDGSSDPATPEPPEITQPTSNQPTSEQVVLPEGDGNLGSLPLTVVLPAEDHKRAMACIREIRSRLPEPKTMAAAILSALEHAVSSYEKLRTSDEGDSDGK